MGELRVAVEVTGVKEYVIQQVCCPTCKSKEIMQVDPPEYGTRSMACDICENFWIEKLS